jgi:hypothetical protein
MRSLEKSASRALLSGKGRINCRFLVTMGVRWEVIYVRYACILYS